MLENVRSDLPSGVGDIVRKMMAKRPEDRYQTPREVATALAPLSQELLPAGYEEGVNFIVVEPVENIPEPDFGAVETEEEMSKTVVVSKVAAHVAPIPEPAPSPDPILDAESPCSGAMDGKPCRRHGAWDGTTVVLLAALVLCIFFLILALAAT